MSTAELIHTCGACGAEEALDSLLLRMIDDDQVRHLIADLLSASLPVGGMVVRYLRLHKPAKQKLRMSRVKAILDELVPDILRAAVDRKGRQWHAPMDAWHHAFAAVFDAQQQGRLRLPLPDNAYLYEVLLRQADRAEAQQERDRHETAKQRMQTADVVGPCAVPPMRSIAAAVPAAAPTAAPAPQPGTSPLVRQMKAEREAALARRGQTTEDAQP